MITTAASERVFSMDGHVVNSRSAKSNEFVSDQKTLFPTVLLKLRITRSKLTKRFHIFTLRCFLRASVGSKMNH